MTMGPLRLAFVVCVLTVAFAHPFDVKNQIKKSIMNGVKKTMQRSQHKEDTDVKVLDEFKKKVHERLHRYDESSQSAIDEFKAEMKSKFAKQKDKALSAEDKLAKMKMEAQLRASDTVKRIRDGKEGPKAKATEDAKSELQDKLNRLAKSSNAVRETMAGFRKSIQGHAHGVITQAQQIKETRHEANEKLAETLKNKFKTLMEQTQKK